MNNKLSAFTPEQLETARIERNRKLREWRKANPDKVKAQEIRSLLRAAEKRAAKERDSE